MNDINWNANLSRKICEIELFKHEGYPLRVCTKKYGKFSKGAKKVLLKMADHMPEGIVKDALIEMIPRLRPPPELKIQQSCIIRDGKKSRHDELLTDEYLGRIVRTLALIKMSPGKICQIINGLDGDYNFSEDQVDKFLFRYWNTRADHGWSIHMEQEYEQFLGEGYHLKQQFWFELQHGFGHMPHSDVFINLEIATNEQWLDHLILNTMKKIDSSLENLDLDKRLPPENVASVVQNATRIRSLEMSTLKELSMALNRFSKTRVDLLKMENFGKAEIPQLRVHRSNTPVHSNRAFNY